MKIGVPSIKILDDKVVIQASIDNFEENNLWFEIDKNYKDCVTFSSDPFLIGIILPAMKKGEDIIVEGKISKDLFLNLSTTFQHVILQLMPFLKPVKIICQDAFYESNKKENNIVTGFSSGIDSYSTLDDYYFNNMLPEYKINHLIFNQVGAHGKKEETFFKKYQLLKKISDQLNLPFIKVNSNLRKFYEGLSFKQTHTIRNAVIPHLLEPMIFRFLYSSGYSYKNIMLSASDDCAYIDPVILPLLSTSNLTLISVGSEYSRVEKTKKVSKLNISYNSLDVCTDNKRDDFSKNCSQCSKCLRTMLTLDLTENLEKYSTVFDLEKYFNLKEEYISSLSINDPLEAEILKYIKDNQIE